LFDVQYASQRHTWQDIAKRIRHQTEKYRWQFLFLGANQDAIATAGKMSIHSGNPVNFAVTDESYAASKSALSRKMTAVRLSSQGPNDEETLQEAPAPLEHLREEEENRGK
jgi:hypothetical protein